MTATKALGVLDLLSAAQVSEVKRLQLMSRRKVDSTMLGEYRSAFRGSGLVFSDLREYQPGDEVKNIHWKALARSGRVYVKSYQEDRQLRIVIGLDISTSTDFGADRSKQQKALEFSALLTVLAESSQDALGLCLFSDRVERFIQPKSGRTHTKILLSELLSKRSLHPATNIAAALTHLRSNLKRRSIVFILSDFYSSPFSQELKALSRKHEVILVHLEDQLDYELPAAGIVRFKDAESGEFLSIDSKSKSLRAELVRRQQQRLAILRKIAEENNADFIVFKDNALKALSILMHQRRKKTAVRG